MPLLYMPEDIPKDNELYRRAVKIEGMAIAFKAWQSFSMFVKEKHF